MSTPKYTPMIEQYLEVKNEHKDSILFFQLGDFYEMFFDHAEIAAKVLGIALTARDAGQKDKIPMCGIPVHAVDNYLPKLIDQGYKVAICEQVQDPSEAKGIVKREVTRIVTPGVTLEDKLLKEEENNYILAIYIKDTSYGIAVADISTGDFLVTSDSYKSSKALLDNILAYRPKEILLIEREDKIYDKLIDNNLYITYLDEYLKISDLDPIEIFQKQFGQTTKFTNAGKIKQEQVAVDLNIIEQTTAGYLFYYISITQKRQLKHLTKIIKIDSDERMLLDYNAKKNLELTETLQAKDKLHSLFWVLDKTETAIGARLLKDWIENPLYKKDKILSRLDAIDELLVNTHSTKEIRKLLKDTYDIERLIGRISYGSANARDLLALKNTLLILPKLRILLENYQKAFIKDIRNDLRDVDLLTNRLDRAIVDNPPLAIKDGGMIKEGFDDKLDEYKNLAGNGKDWLLSYEQSEREKTKIKNLKVGYNKIFGYYIDVTRSYINLVPDYYERKQTLANSERYITQELKAKEDMILKADDNLIKLEYEIFLELRDYTINFIPDLQIIAKAIARLDVLQSLGQVAERNNYSKPSFNEKGEIIIRQGRHPVIEQVINRGDFVPNDLTLNNENIRIQLITGPNMAGKSTYMRQAALIIIMAQMGSYVPADYANLALVDRIFTRIGASDDLTSGQSTFMVEMVETKDALNEATENSLILLDEVGRGTSTYDGMALAQAIIEYISSVVQAKTLFSTHYHELTALDQELTCLKNYSASAIEQDKKVIFLHQVVPGKADKSYGIYVADLAGMPGPVTQRAKEILIELEKLGRDHIIESAQLSIFTDQGQNIETKNTIEITSNEYQVLKDLKQTQVMQLTPLDALNYLYQLQKKLDSEGE